MLDGADRDAGVVAQHRAQREVLDVIDVGRDFRDDAAALADQEAVAGIGLRRVQHHRHARAAVDAGPGELDFAANRSLSRPDKSLRHPNVPSIPHRQECRPVSEHPVPPDHPVASQSILLFGLDKWPLAADPTARV